MKTWSWLHCASRNIICPLMLHLLPELAHGYRNEVSFFPGHHDCKACSQCCYLQAISLDIPPITLAGTSENTICFLYMVCCSEASWVRSGRPWEIGLLLLTLNEEGEIGIFPHVKRCYLRDTEILITYCGITSSIASISLLPFFKWTDKRSAQAVAKRP